MAVTHFIPTIWSKAILDDLEAKAILTDHCHKRYEGDVKRAGSVKILGVGEPTIGDYNKTDINVEALTDKSQTLLIDQAKYFAFYVDDVDDAQSVPGLPEEFRRKAVHKLHIARETYVANLIKSGKNTTEVTALTEEAMVEGIDDAIVELRERDFDEEGVIELTPKAYNLFKKSLIKISTDNPEYIKKGLVGMYDGFKVYMSNCLAKDASFSYCCVRGEKAIAFAGQLEKVTAQPVEKRFADIVKGLDVYGAKVIDDNRIQVIKVPVA